MKGKNNDAASAWKLKEAYDENVRILNSMTDGYFSLDSHSVILDINEPAEKLLGLKKHEIVGKVLWDIFPAARDLKFFTAHMEAMKTGKPVAFEEYYEPWGKWFKATVYPVKTGLTSYFRDITEERRLELNHSRTEEIIRKLLTAQKIGKLGYWSADLVNDNVEWSREVCDIFGVDYESFTPNLENWMACVFPDDRDKFQKNFKTIFSNQKYFDFEHRIITPDGTVKWILERLNLQTDKKGNPVSLEGISQDITQQKSHEKEIHDSLMEKEILLVEIHHRVKNNLAVIAGLMQLQAYEEPSEAVRERLLECVGRIVSMSSIHEQLYNSKSFSNLDYSKNLKNLIKSIVETMQIGKEIGLNFDLEQVTLNVNQAIPTSLIINEVTTNVLKHAFTGRKKGEIHVIMTETDQTLKISVSDNGNGLPDDFNADERKTLGLRLVDILVQQLKGSYEFNSVDDGTSFVMMFRKTDITG